MPKQYKLARKMKGIALTAAAKELGVSQPTLSAWESERKNPSIDALIRMSEFYGVSVDFLLGITADHDLRIDLLRPIEKDVLLALHERPVYSSAYGWAFVDAVNRQLIFANGNVLPISEAHDIFLLPSSFEEAAFPSQQALSLYELDDYGKVWVEPISCDKLLRDELRGWYEVKSRYVENIIGQRFYKDFYKSKWLAFSEPENITLRK